MGSWFDSVSDTRGKNKKILVFPIGVEPMTFWLLVLSYRRLVGAKAIKLVACVGRNGLRKEPGRARETREGRGSACP